MSALAEVTKPAAQSTDDLDLVAAVRAGDDRAFELLFARYQSRISAYVRGMVRDHGRAEDITQEVFIAALRRMRETDKEIAFKPWIYEIAKNACIDAFRRTRNTSEVSLDAEDALGPSDRGRLAAVGGAPDDAVAMKLSLDNLCGAFGGLSQQHHEILVMREFEGLSYREIGERLRMSRAGVESTLFRARRRLSEEYEEIASGARCLRVRAIADAAGGRSVAGLRDRRRLARHISHCQPCRRYVLAAGVDLAAVRLPAAVASKVAALLPLPSFLRRRLEAEQVLGVHSSPALNLVTTIDPSTASAWSKAVATAATVAVAGLGAGAAVKHDAVEHFISRAPSMVGLAPGGPAAKQRPAREQALEQAASQVRTARSASTRDTPGTGGGVHESSATKIVTAAHERAPGSEDALPSAAASPSSASNPLGASGPPAGQPAGAAGGPAGAPAGTAPGSAELSGAADRLLHPELPAGTLPGDEPAGDHTLLQPPLTMSNGLHTVLGEVTSLGSNGEGAGTTLPGIELPNLDSVNLEDVIRELPIAPPSAASSEDDAPTGAAGGSAAGDNGGAGPGHGHGAGSGHGAGGSASSGPGADAAGGAVRAPSTAGADGAGRGQAADAPGGRRQVDGTARSDAAARVLAALRTNVVTAGKPAAPSTAAAGTAGEAAIGAEDAARALDALRRHDFLAAADAAGLDRADILRGGLVIATQRPDFAAALQADAATAQAAREKIVAMLVTRAALRASTSGRR
jgi:RNA polymerase sigma factor (sigma-70 family)